ncbi:hypothetical protein [Azospirillum sp. SYSU D00513]|uniref:hypothetical protein n=1 Tax=Azospirillum sp. SYSU D00513 TaxID=2812561 RepID=UPI001A9636B2|nr:hypothetical protein [Azospirillum sp. SYSU D00513]
MNAEPPKPSINADDALEAQLMEGLDGPDEEIDIEAMRAEGRALIQASKRNG